MTTVIICIDGFDPAYLDACDMPNLREMARKGFLTFGKSMMPSVTNVNNVSIATGVYPESHGICSNYRLASERGDEVYMESGEYILAETFFQRLRSRGGTSILVTAKDKLRTLLADGAAASVSSEMPPEGVVAAVGEPPGIYTLEVNGWVIRAGSYLIGRDRPEVAYLTTTDYAMHAFAPDEPEARSHMSILDDAIGDLVSTHPGATVMVTADHGMSPKKHMVDLERALAHHGIAARAVPIIKDRYVVHHSNLGGCIFVHLQSGDTQEAIRILEGTPGVERALAREEAAESLRMHSDRIGDIVVTGEPDVVFGDPSQVVMPHRLRSHGSEHERAVPILGYNGHFEGMEFEENRDVGRYVFERVLA